MDPTCLFHGKKWSEHEYGQCLYCCLCFRELTPESCTRNYQGQLEDICVECRAQEEKGNG